MITKDSVTVYVNAIMYYKVSTLQHHAQERLICITVLTGGGSFQMWLFSVLNSIIWIQWNGRWRTRWRRWSTWTTTAAQRRLWRQPPWGKLQSGGVSEDFEKVDSPSYLSPQECAGNTESWGDPLRSGELTWKPFDPLIRNAWGDGEHRVNWCSQWEKSEVMVHIDKVMIAKEIHALLVEGTDHWGVQVQLEITSKVFSPNMHQMRSLKIKTRINCAPAPCMKLIFHQNSKTWQRSEGGACRGEGCARARATDSGNKQNNLFSSVIPFFS